VLTASGLTGAGLEALWTQVERRRDVLGATGERAARRAEQDARWMWALVRERLEEAFRRAPAVAGLAGDLEAAVRAGALPASLAADRLLAAFGIEGG
jgi:LAO/AO transport system kinase